MLVALLRGNGGRTSLFQCRANPVPLWARLSFGLQKTSARMNSIQPAIERWVLETLDAAKEFAVSIDSRLGSNPMPTSGQPILTPRSPIGAPKTQRPRRGRAKVLETIW